ncbi:MAG TPA: amino acid deaminase, partial [Planctomycetota bacterium]|nr:amino acid deaminase [Planctomycetota bacterium]
MNLAEIASRVLDSTSKGIPGPGTVTPGTVAQKGWNLLKDDLPYPVMVLLDSAVEHNLRTMAKWCAANGFLFSPHGKTTMCPQLYRRQLEAGAWGITVASAQQARVAVKFGVRTILIANQLVGRSNIRSIAQAVQADPALEITCVADSVEGVEHLAGHWKEAGAARPLRVLLEGGREGWRTGVRSLAEGRDVLGALRRKAGILEFAGFEGYEGIARLEEGALVQEYLQGLIRDVDLLARELPAPPTPYIFTVGGTSFLDYQHEILPALTNRYRVIVRSGCYITHDHGNYVAHVKRTHARGMGDEAWPPLRQALELWSLVQSVRDGRTAILTFGRRDCPHDGDFPLPLYAVRPGQSRAQAQPLEGAKVARLNDQHAFMTIPSGVELHVGDRIACGIIHPCTAFDKWPVIPLVDDDYRV